MSQVYWMPFSIFEFHNLNITNRTGIEPSGKEVKCWKFSATHFIHNVLPFFGRHPCTVWWDKEFNHVFNLLIRLQGTAKRHAKHTDEEECGIECSTNVSNICWMANMCQGKFGYAFSPNLRLCRCLSISISLPLLHPTLPLLACTIIINIISFALSTRDDINYVFAHLLNHIDAIIRHEKQRCHCGNNLCMRVRVFMWLHVCVWLTLLRIM